MPDIAGLIERFSIVDELHGRIAMAPIKGAWLSDDRIWRWVLWRIWDAAARPLVICGHNPSRADESYDDPTIRRDISFAKRDGFGGILKVNLYGYRATDPKQIKGLAYIGDLNNAIISAVANNVTVLCAWGAIDAFGRAPEVMDLLSVAARTVCLGKTKTGAPRHPLYVKGTQPLEAFP